MGGSPGVLELILQPFRHFTYVTTHSPTLPSLYLRHSSFSNPSVALPTSQFILQPFFASPTSQALHLIYLASRPWKEPLWRASIPGIYRIPSMIHCVRRDELEALWELFGMRLPSVSLNIILIHVIFHHSDNKKICMMRKRKFIQIH